MKRLLIFFSVFSLIVIFALLSSCLDDELKANESVTGLWEVTSIKSFYGQFTHNGGHSKLDIKSEEGNLGYFNFAGSGEVSYKFYRNDTTYEDNSKWYLRSRDERNSGFKITKYTLEILNDCAFEVKFGDGSKNSHKNTRRLELINWPNKPGFGVGIIMQLSKQ